LNLKKYDDYITKKMDSDDYVLISHNDDEFDINSEMDESLGDPLLGQDNTYEVDKLLDSKIKKGNTYYLVKWQGDYPNSWEPEDNINTNLIRQYLLNEQIKKHNNNIVQSNTYAHLYLRVSDRSKTSELFRKTQTEEKSTTQSYFSAFPEGNFSLDTQKEMLMNYCIEKNMLIKSIEYDDGVSARNPLKLNGLRRIIDNIDTGEILLILDLSRFARNTQVGLELLNEIELKGAKLYSILDGMNYDTPSAKHCVRTTLSCAQLESDVKSIKVKQAIENIRKRGGYLGGTPKFGFKVIRDGTIRRLIKDDDEQQILDTISNFMFKYNDNRFKNRMISDELNNHMITYRGKKYTPMIISRLIKSNNIIPKKNNNPKPLYISFAKNKHLKREKMFNNARFGSYGNINFAMVLQMQNLNLNNNNTNVSGSITELD
jgi:DNA invertase Pin-like site-specific DNA recombinase